MRCSPQEQIEAFDRHVKGTRTGEQSWCASRARRGTLGGGERKEASKSSSQRRSRTFQFSLVSSPASAAPPEHSRQRRTHGPRGEGLDSKGHFDDSAKKRKVGVWGRGGEKKRRVLLSESKETSFFLFFLRRRSDRLRRIRLSINQSISSNSPASCSPHTPAVASSAPTTHTA